MLHMYAAYVCQVCYDQNAIRLAEPRDIQNALTTVVQSSHLLCREGDIDREQQ